MSIQLLGQARAEAWARQGWERMEEMPWILYFLGCALACIVAMLVTGGFRVLWQLCARLVVRIRGFVPGSAMVVLLAMLLGGCDRTFFAWQGPTRNFLAYDIDRDTQISREEWERWYGTSALEPAVLDFDRGDCDRNGRLTWNEYFRLRFRKDRCAPGGLELLLARTVPTPSGAHDSASIFSAKEIDQARVSLVRSRQRLVEAKYHAGYSEQDLALGTPRLFRMYCGEPQPVDIPHTSRDFHEISRLPRLDPGSYPAVRCTVENLMRVDTITCLRLRFAWEASAGSVRTLHVKTLWIPPRSSRDFWVLPAAPALTIDLLSVRIKQT